MNEYHHFRPGQTLHSKYDPFLKTILSAAEDWCEESTGDTESPTGFFGIFEVPDSHVLLASEEDKLWWRQLNDEFFKPMHNYDIEFALTPGWYAAYLDGSGLVWGLEMESEQAALEWYNSRSEDYIKWETSEEEEG